MLKENIENKQKIKYELALDTMVVIVNMDVQNILNCLLNQCLQKKLLIMINLILFN